MEIFPNVHAITGMAVNCYLIEEPDGLVLVDTGLRNYERRIKGVIEALGKRARDLRHILITHADGDHVGCLSTLKAATGARAYASELEAQAIAQGESSRELKFSGPARVMVNMLSGIFAFKPVQIDEVLNAGQELPILGGLKVLATPGHTPDHISFFSASTGILFAGDSMRASKNGLSASSGANTWDETLARQSVHLQRTLKPEIVCVGHGPVITQAAAKFPQL